MRRKVIQLANSTSVVSLPSKWVKKWGVKKGDEVEVEEQESRLVLSTNYTYQEKKEEIEVNMAGKAPRALLWSLVGLYKAGYDRIKVTYDDTIQLENIHRIVANVLEGFQITEEGNGFCTVETVSKQSDQEFFPIFKKTLRLVALMARNSFEAIQTGNQGKLKDILILEETNNKLSNLCERILTKGVSFSPSLRAQCFVMAWHSQKICNYYRDICRYLLDHSKLKLSKKLLELYAYATDVVEQYDALYNRLDISKLVELYVETRNKISSLDLAGYNKQEQPVLANLLFLLNRVSDISTMLIGFHELTRPKQT